MGEETTKRMGRPRKYAEARRRLTLELPDELVERVKEYAYQRHETLTATVQRILEEQVSERKGSKNGVG